MGVIKRGILGGVQNKIGNVVGSSWKGIATLRSLPLSVANPKTAPQLAQRSKFSQASKFGSMILAGAIKPLWDRFAQQESGYNAFVRANINNFEIGDTPNWSNMMISKGTVSSSPITSASLDDSAGTLTVNWDSSVGGDSSPTDQAYVVLVCSSVEPLAAIAYAEAADRSAGTCTLPVGVPDFLQTYQVYLSFRRPDGSKVSNSSHIQIVAVS